MQSEVQQLSRAAYHCFRGRRDFDFHRWRTKFKACLRRAKNSAPSLISLRKPHFHDGQLSQIYTSLMLVIARSTQKELARQVSYPEAENRILRSRLPCRISLTQREKARLVRFAHILGSALNELATVVHPGTIRR